MRQATHTGKKTKSSALDSDDGRTPLTGKQRSFLRALAHELKPVAQVGRHGLTASVTREVADRLTSHELIKVKAGGECSVESDSLGTELERQADCHLVQVIGRTLVLYRRHPTEPRIELPEAKRARRKAG
jgi:RNA-binding protein